jgi:hypothetical protein
MVSGSSAVAVRGKSHICDRLGQFFQVAQQLYFVVGHAGQLIRNYFFVARLAHLDVNKAALDPLFSTGYASKIRFFAHVRL